MKYLFTFLSFYVFTIQPLIAQITWAEDVSCILYTHCTNCHNPNGIAPFSLMNYSDAYNLRQAIQLSVNMGTMPPWPADPAYQTHAHERLLTQQEITTINEWVNVHGGQEGDPTLAPPPPVYTTSEVITNPDLVLTLPNYTSQATSSDEYRCFVINNPYNTDIFLTGIEYIPGNPALIHHILLFKDGTNAPSNNDNNEPGPGYVCFGGTGSNDSDMIGAWAPGGTPSFTPSGMGMFVEAGDVFVVQVHYPAGTVGQSDVGTKINLQLTTNQSTRPVYTDFILNHWSSITNGPLYILPNDYATFYAEYTLPVDVTILSVAPHMHLIGESIKCYAVLPNNTQINLIDIPHWDFEWQGSYVFRNPLKLPAGTKLKSEAFYNNTVTNTHNPNNPPQLVTAGESTTDEMMLVGFAYTAYQPGDENIIVDTTTQTIDYCDTVQVTVLPDLSPIITVVPANIAGVSSVGIAVRLTEINQKDTDGTNVKVRIPIDPRLSFTWDPALTFVGFNQVQNNKWTYSSTPLFHEFTFPQMLGGGLNSSFGLEATYDPQNTNGQTTITATIVPYTGGEDNAANNSDSEVVIYFN